MIIIQANGAERELEEKILALLRREDIAAERVSLSSRHTLTFPELTIDGRSQQAFQNGTALALTRIEFNMLLFLASNPGVTLSKEDLFSAVWGRDSADTLKVVANTVSNLRRKLGGSQTYIRTVRGGTCSRRSPPPPEVLPSKQIEVSNRVTQPGGEQIFSTR